MFKDTDRNDLQHISADTKNMLDAVCKFNAMTFERNKVLENEISDLKYENGALKIKVNLYEKFIAKMLETDSDKSNEIFMFDGEIYRLTDYHKYGGVDELKTLTAEFRCMTGITKNFKENNDG